MAAALRSLRRAQVLLLPRINVTAVRAESGGKSSPHTGISKTLVSFPVKVSHFQQPATGENRNESLKPVKAALLDLGESGGQSDREMQLGQEVLHSGAQSIHGTPPKDDDSSSSSSSDSSSDSESEDNAPVTKGESGGEYKGLPSVTRKSSSILGHTSLDKECPIAEEQKSKMDVREANAEDLQDIAPTVSSEEQSLHTAPRSANITLPGADKMETPDGTVPTGGTSSTAAVRAEEIKILSTFEEHHTGGVVTVAPESGDTQLLSTTESEELSVELKMAAAESMEFQILSTPSSEELLAEVETLMPESLETQILSTPSSEELLAGGGETLMPESVKTQILSTPSSEELLAGGGETVAPESMETQILSPTSEELPAEEGVAEPHDSHSPVEPCAAPQEPFDNTKYQNLQHFNYTPFTFVDVDIEMAKYRLPQPTSGRPSPRH